MILRVILDVSNLGKEVGYMSKEKVVKKETKKPKQDKPKKEKKVY